MLIGDVTVITHNTASVGVNVFHLSVEDSGKKEGAGKVDVMCGLDDVFIRHVFLLGELEESVAVIDVHLHKVLTEAVALPREAIHEWGSTLKGDTAFIPFAAAAYLWNGEIEEMIAGVGIKPVEESGDFLSVDDVLVWCEPIVDLIEIEFEIVVLTEDIVLDPCESAAVFSVYAMPLVFIFERVGT